MPSTDSNQDAPQTEAENLALPVIDRENAFLLYATFVGDVARTAHALNVDERLVESLAKEYKWNDKIKPLLEMRRSGKPGDFERAINRALNFVDAHRYRMFLVRVVRELTGMTPTDLKAFLFPQKSQKDGAQFKFFSTRALSDLAAALEKCQSLTYIALNDTATERKERKEDGGDEGESASELHVRLARAMSEVSNGSGSVKELVLDAQLKVGQLDAVDARHETGEALPRFVPLDGVPRQP